MAYVDWRPNKMPQSCFNCGETQSANRARFTSFGPSDHEVLCPKCAYVLTIEAQHKARRDSILARLL